MALKAKIAHDASALVRVSVAEPRKMTERRKSDWSDQILQTKPSVSGACAEGPEWPLRAAAGTSSSEATPER